MIQLKERRRASGSTLPRQTQSLVSYSFCACWEVDKWLLIPWLGIVRLIKLTEPRMIGSFGVIDKIMGTLMLKYDKMYCFCYNKDDMKDKLL